MVTISDLTQDLAITGREVVVADDGEFGVTKQLVLTETSVTPAASLSLLFANYLKEVGIVELKLNDGSVLTTADILDSAMQFTDNTAGDVSQAKHGFFPKLPVPAGLYLKDDLTWSLPSGAGDVMGPASAINNNLAVFDDVSGKLIKDGGQSINDILTDPVFIGNTELALDKYYYIGNESTDGSIRIGNMDGATTFDTRVAGVWKSSFIIPAPQNEE